KGDRGLLPVSPSRPTPGPQPAAIPFGPYSCGAVVQPGNTSEEFVLKMRAGASPLRRWGGMVVVVLAGLAFVAKPAEAQADGEKVYNTVCASCHQANGQGIPGAFPPVAESEWVTGDPA